MCLNQANNQLLSVRMRRVRRLNNPNPAVVFLSVSVLRSPSGGQTEAAAAKVSQGCDDHKIHLMNLLKRERFSPKASEVALRNDD